MYLNSAEYKELKSMVAYICSITQEMAQNSFDAYTNKDIKKAQYIRERDKELDSYSLKMDELSGKIIALYWPRGSDMRYILSTIKTSSDFERIGDHCKKIGKQIVKLQNSSFIFEMSSIKDLFENVIMAVTSACDAYYRLDVEKAEDIIKNDTKIDILKSAAIKDIIQFMSSCKSETGEAAVPDLKTGINLINVARRLERMADHATNIAEAVCYIVKGTYDFKDSVNEECASN